MTFDQLVLHIKTRLADMVPRFKLLKNCQYEVSIIKSTVMIIITGEFAHESIQYFCILDPQEMNFESVEENMRAIWSELADIEILRDILRICQMCKGWDIRRLMEILIENECESFLIFNALGAISEPVLEGLEVQRAQELAAIANILKYENIPEAIAILEASAEIALDAIQNVLGFMHNNFSAEELRNLMDDDEPDNQN